jgi:16S rRNA A1518/A1519 N6-dimethyltransferase RsmA/KsgA/DIM1 with predicted DNA glycosylase/AP lyase activity
LNYRYDVKYLKNVPAKAFSPAPNVDSCIVELIIKNQKPNLKFDRLIEFLDNVSMFKRKTL